MILLLIGIFLFFLGFTDLIFKNYQKKVILFIICTLFVIVGGIRWNTGTDWNAYYYGFLATDSYQNATSKFSFEWGFSMFNYLVRSNGGSYTIFLILFTFIKIFLKYKVFVDKEFIRYSLFSFFLYYCYSNADILSTRQGLAVSFTFFSTFFLFNNKKWYFFLFVFLAFLIHKTAIFFAIAYFVFNLNMKVNKLYFLFFGSMILGLIFFQMDVSNLLTSIPILNKINMFQDKVEAYSKSGQVTYGEIDSITTIVLGYIKKIFVVVPILLNFKVFAKNRKMVGLINILIFGCVCYFVLGSISSEFKRINAYFEIYEVLLIPYLIYNIKNGKLKLLLIFIFSIYAIVRLYAALTMFWDLVDPYYTIFDLYNYRNMY